MKSQQFPQGATSDPLLFLFCVTSYMICVHDLNYSLGYFSIVEYLYLDSPKFLKFKRSKIRISTPDYDEVETSTRWAIAALKKKNHETEQNIWVNCFRQYKSVVPKRNWRGEAQNHSGFLSGEYIPTKKQWTEELAELSRQRLESGATEQLKFARWGIERKELCRRRSLKILCESPLGA